MENKKQGFLARYVKIIVVFAVVAGSSSGIFGSVIEAPSMAIGFWRLSLGMPVFAIPVLLKQRDVLKKNFNQELHMDLRGRGLSVPPLFTWFNAVKLTDIGSASVLAALHPLIVLVITIFVFRRKVGVRPVMGIILALAGRRFDRRAGFQTVVGKATLPEMLAFLAAMFMGLYFTVGNEVRKRYRAALVCSLVFLACWICFAVGMVVTKTPVFGYSTTDYVYIIGLTLVCQIGAHAVFNLCFGHVDSLYVSAWESGECVSAIIMGVIFLGQVPTSLADHRLCSCGHRAFVL